MLAVFEMLAPVLLLIGLGAALAAFGFLPEQGWRAVDRLLYFVLFPALIVEALSRMAAASLDAAKVALVLGLSQAVIVAAIYALRPFVLGQMGRSRPAFTSLVQAGVRWNTVLAVSLAASLQGDRGVLLIACGISVMIPVANLVSVSALTFDGDNDHAVTISGIAGQLLRNPFLIAVTLGLLLAFSPVALPRVAASALHQIAVTSPAVGLLCVGAAIDLKGMGRFDGLALLSALLKLGAMPLVVSGFASAMGLDPVAHSVALIAASVPTASASYVLARQMGGDAELMARIIALHTALALVTVPAILILAG
jgi:predicted permease